MSTRAMNHVQCSSRLSKQIIRSSPRHFAKSTHRSNRLQSNKLLINRAANITAKVSKSKGEAVTYDDLVAYLASGSKPRDQWRIGTEHEKFGFMKDDLTPMTYKEIEQLLQGLQNRFGWEPIMEGEKIIGVKQAGQSVTLEPGGQFELSGAPLESLHQTCAEVNSHLYQVKSIAEEIGVAFLGLGFQPKWTVEETPIMPKGRYEIMRKYMPTVGSMGLDMMFRTCTVQVNLDFEDEKDMVEKFRVSLALQPISTALFANSPFKDGKPNGLVSYRSHVWTDTDNARTGDLPWVFEEGMGFARYVDWMLDVPMYFVYRNGNYLNATGLSFRDWMEGRLELEGLEEGDLPTLEDWEQHLTTAFPEVRLKKFLEMRGADSGPWRQICALPAFWVGLLYDEQAQKEALELISDWTAEERAAMKVGVSTSGLKTPFRDTDVRQLAQQCLDIAEGGLKRRGNGEESFLKALKNIVESGMSPADVMLSRFEDDWNGDVDNVYREMMY